MLPKPQPLARLLASLADAREQEAVRVARFLHDDVGQVLSAAGLQLDLLRMDVERDAPETSRRIAECQQLLAGVFERIRLLASELDPSVVSRAGLHAALDRLVGRYRAIAARPVRLLSDSSVRLPLEAAKACHKIAECALDNAVRHSGASRVEILLRPSRNAVVLEVSDDGAGFDLETTRLDPPGLGLLLMDCHAARGGLELSVRTAPGNGTIVRAVFPLQERRPAVNADGP
jgi:signal transduction histidine kinase